MSKESEAYEQAKAEAVAAAVLHYRQTYARWVAREIFGGTPEQQEETYQYLMGDKASTPD